MCYTTLKSGVPEKFINYNSEKVKETSVRDIYSYIINLTNIQYSLFFQYHHKTSPVMESPICNQEFPSTSIRMDTPKSILFCTILENFIIINFKALLCTTFIYKYLTLSSNNL